MQGDASLESSLRGGLGSINAPHPETHLPTTRKPEHRGGTECCDKKDTEREKQFKDKKKKKESGKEKTDL